MELIPHTDNPIHSLLELACQNYQLKRKIQIMLPTQVQVERMTYSSRKRILLHLSIGVKFNTLNYYSMCSIKKVNKFELNSKKLSELTFQIVLNFTHDYWYMSLFML